MKLDIYLRVSRLADEKQRSIEGQEHDARARVADAGATVGEVHTDRGRSAWNPRVRRQGWDLLMSRLESGATDGVVVFDLERFSRQPLEGERLLSVAGNGLRVLDSDSEYDLTSPSGRKAFRDQMAAAAYYSDRLSSRTRRGKRIKAAAGEVDRRRSFGFEADGVTVNEAEAAIIRELARRLLDGEPQSRLMTELNQRGILTSYGNHWVRTSVTQMMTRPRNGGYIVHAGEITEGVRLPGEPILDETTYRRVLALYAARKSGRPISGRYVLTGLLDCGLCGHHLNGKPRRNHPYKDGTLRRQYWCAPSNGGCGRITVDSREMDDWAAEWAMRELSDPATASSLARAEEELEAQRSRLVAELAEVDGLITALDDRLGRRELSLERYERIIKPLEADRERYRAEIDELVASSEPRTYARVFTPRDIAYLTLLALWDEGDEVEQRRIVTSALRGRKIVVGRGRSARFDPERCRVAP
jgi:DNA invertase Pin-like site-specific DNA recombinase